jgi:hypothetical protein
LVAYPPGPAMRRIADLHAGEAKADARGAAIIAEAARSMPHTLRSLRLADELLAELSMLCGFDDDLAAQITQTSEKTLANRLTNFAPHMGKSLAAEIVQALSEQAVIVSRAQAATIVMPRLAQQLASLRKQREEVASEVERLVHAHSL